MVRLIAASCLVLVGLGSLQAQIYIPESGTHTWNSATNWQSPASIPNGVGVTANFNNPGTSPGVLNVTLDTDITLGQLNITNNTTHARTISSGSGGRLTFEQPSSADAGISFSGTGNSSTTISSNITLNVNLAVQVSNTVSTTGLVLSGNITGSQGVLKTGNGILTLAGNNDYSGSTMVNGGTLLINGNQSNATGAVTVASGATLMGSGSAGGDVEVQAGGKLQAGTGTATGTLTTGSVTILNGAILQVAVATGNASGVVNAGDLTLNFDVGAIIKLKGIGPITAYNQWTLATLTNGSEIYLGGNTVANNQVLAEFVQGTGASGDVQLDLSELGFTLATGEKISVFRLGNSLVAEHIPVPEPAHFLGLGGMMLVAGLARRKLT